MTRYTMVILTLAAAACGGPLPPPTDSTALLAQSVTIYRDRYGVPYIYGPTDASAVFGFAYAQAEDNFDQIEDSYIHALGRAAEAYGESEVPQDWLNRALEVTSLSQAEYGQLGTRARQICDAFAAGLNFFLRTHPHVKPRLLTRFENWHVLALLRHRRHQRESVEMSGLSPGELKALGSGGTGGGSNALAVGPSKSAAGGAMLIAAPHRQFFGADQFYEGHLRSDEGWRLWGITFVGLPFPHLGFNEQVAWTHTVNTPDIADLYVETFDGPAQPAEYRYGDRHRAVRTWTDEIRVRTDTGMATRRFDFRKTHHGPLVVVRDGKHVALKLARIEEGGMLEQWYDMSRARSLDEFRTALARLALPVLEHDLRGRRRQHSVRLRRRDSPSIDGVRLVPASRWQQSRDGVARLPSPRRASASAQSCERLCSELQLQSVRHDERRESHAGAVSPRTWSAPLMTQTTCGGRWRDASSPGPNRSRSTSGSEWPSTPG